MARRPMLSRRLLPVLLLLTLTQAISAHAAVSVVRIDHPIHPVTASFLERTLEAAAEAGDPLVVVKLDTPGGLGDSMKEMIQDILDSKVPVCVWVAPSGARAASAGFMILLSADVAAMSPGTNTGSAHPIFTGAEVEEEGKRHILLEKVENDAAAFARTLAENRDRNVELAEQVVLESSNFTEREALDENLIDLIASDLDDLLGQLDGRTIRRFGGDEEVLRLEGEPVRHVEMSTREEMLSVIANPSFSFALLSLGLLGLYVEFTHPGLIFPGVIGGISLLLFGFSVQILPINWVGLLLILAGLALFALEVKVTSYGALTVGGILCLVLGGLMLYDTPNIPELRIPLGLLISMSVAVGVITAALLSLVVGAHRHPVATGGEGLTGKVGQTLTDLNPEGKVFIHGEYWDARSDEPLAQGEQVRVVTVEGLFLHVERLR